MSKLFTFVCVLLLVSLPSHASPSHRAAKKHHWRQTLLSFEQSAYKKLPPRWVFYLEKNKRLPRLVDLSEVIVQEARKQHLDPLIVSLIIQHESGFRHNAVSAAGALGLMQLMPGTAHDLGVTDPLNPVQNVAAGTRYFARQYRHFGELHQALAAYNAGPGLVPAVGIPRIPETVHYAHSIASEYRSLAKAQGQG